MANTTHSRVDECLSSKPNRSRTPSKVAALIMTVAAAAGQVHADPRQPSRTVGVYHWGARPTRSMSEGIAQVAALGGHTVRITMSPRHYSDYGSGGCNASLGLTALAQEPDVRRALDA